MALLCYLPRLLFLNCMLSKRAKLCRLRHLKIFLLNLSECCRCDTVQGLLGELDNVAGCSKIIKDKLEDPISETAMSLWRDAEAVILRGTVSFPPVEQKYIDIDLEDSHENVKKDGSGVSQMCSDYQAELQALPQPRNKHELNSTRDFVMTTVERLSEACEHEAAAVLLRRYQPLFTDGESFSRYSLATVILQCLMGNYGLAVAGAKVLRGTTTPNLLYKGAAHVVMGMGYLRDAFFDKSLEEFQASSDLPDLGFWSLTDLLTKELLSLYLGLCAMAVLPFKTVCSMVENTSADSSLLRESPLSWQSLSCYAQCDFGSCLDYATLACRELLLDVHCGRSAVTLSDTVRRNVILLYLDAFAFCSVDDMSRFLHVDNKVMEHDIQRILNKPDRSERGGLKYDAVQKVTAQLGLLSTEGPVTLIRLCGVR
eukprot:GHVQ01014722.1.p1 GENE.GHVQ01014722.1~~GHVQ01014722.1.p1  ORF type:complete len:427 (+),score=38.80 GHVQ01014722.1:79-1359(+)